MKFVNKYYFGAFGNLGHPTKPNFQKHFNCHFGIKSEGHNAKLIAAMLLN